MRYLHTLDPDELRDLFKEDDSEETEETEQQSLHNG